MAFTLDITKDFFYQQGEKQGEKRGEIRGEKRGKERKALEIATNLVKEGLPTEVIHRVTQLPAEEIEVLREKLHRGGKKKQ